MKENFIGCEEQMTLLENYFSSNRSEFVAIYGQWRVGKIFLVKELFENQFTFRMTVWQHQQNVSYCLYGSKMHMMTNLFQKKSYPFYKFGELFT